MSDLRRLHEQIQAHPGTVARREWDALLLVHGIWRGNHDELLTFVAAVERNHDDMALTMLSNVGDREPRLALYRELFRFIHNYVAGVVTYVDHTRNLMRTYEGTDVHLEYQRRLGEFKADGLASFVTKLRNFVMHYRVPAIGVQMNVNDGREAITCYYDRDSALALEGWPAEARVFLSSQPQHVPIRQVMMDYADRLEVFYRWIYDQFTVLHGEDVRARNELVKQLPYYDSLVKGTEA